MLRSSKKTVGLFTRTALAASLPLMLLACAAAKTTPDADDPVDWQDHEVKVITSEALNMNTVQTPGMTRAEAISHAMAGAEKLWVGKITVDPGSASGVHHHGPLETVAYVVSGKSKLRWGPNLGHVAEAGPGDFVYVPPYMPHQEINPSAEEPLVAVVIRSDQEPVVIGVEIEGADPVSGSAPQPLFHPVASAEE